MSRKSLLRDLVWVGVAKLVALCLIYALFFSPAHRPDAAATVGDTIFSGPSLQR